MPRDGSGRHEGTSPRPAGRNPKLVNLRTHCVDVPVAVGGQLAVALRHECGTGAVRSCPIDPKPCSVDEEVSAPGPARSCQARKAEQARRSPVVVAIQVGDVVAAGRNAGRALSSAGASGGSQMSARLEHKTALVTGAPSNIGRAIATAFAAEGAHVMVSGRSPERGAEVVEQIRAAGGQPNSSPRTLTAPYTRPRP